jgi:hypothetical protein
MSLEQADCVTTSRAARMHLTPGFIVSSSPISACPTGVAIRSGNWLKHLGINAVLMSGYPDELHVAQLTKRFGVAEFVSLIAKHLGNPPAEDL